MMLSALIFAIALQEPAQAPNIPDKDSQPPPSARSDSPGEPPPFQARTLPKVKQRGRTSAIFNLPKDAVWPALMAALASLNFTPQNTDPASGTVFLLPVTVFDQWKGANQFVALLTTKQVGFFSTWDRITIGGNVVVKSVGPTQSEASVNLSFSALNLSSQTWEQLESNGTEEGLILDTITAKLPEPSSTRRPESANYDALRNVAATVQKIDAAFRLEAGRDQIMGLLVDALSAIEGIHAGRPTEMRIAAALRTAISGYRKALDTNEEREALLEQARGLLEDSNALLQGSGL